MAPGRALRGALAAWIVWTLAEGGQAQYVEEEPPVGADVAVVEDAPVHPPPPLRPRFAMQGRLVLNLFDFTGGLTLQPAVTPGVRFARDRVFIGLGAYFFGIQDDVHGVAGIPTVTVDLLQRAWASLHLVGWVPVGAILTQQEDGGRENSPFIGANVGIGIRGHITEGISIGTEWGWGFGVFFEAGDTELFDRDTVFTHSAFGTILFEAAIGRR
jgi:hypothetical protein